MKSPVNIVAAIGLVLGGVFGLLGTVVTAQNLRAASWGIDGVGLVVATSLLALRFIRKGNDYVAAGFLVFAISCTSSLTHWDLATRSTAATAPRSSSTA